MFAWNCWLVPGWEDMQILEAVARLPMPEQAEAAELLSRYSPADLEGRPVARLRRMLMPWVMPRRSSTYRISW